MNLPIFTDAKAIDVVNAGAFHILPHPDFVRTLNRTDYYKVMRYCRTVRRMMMKAVNEHNH